MHEDIVQLKTVLQQDTAKQNCSSVRSSSRPDAKQKVLFAGDSLSRKLNTSVVRNVTNMEFKRLEVSSIANTNSLEDTVPRELKKEHYSYLILQGGTSEITNLYTNNDTRININEMKDIVRTSSEKLYNLAEKCLEQNDSLKKNHHHEKNVQV